jgi:DNA-3-methyladenine glycosylase II
MARLEPVSLLTEQGLIEAVDDLAARDPDLGAVVARFGRPPLWERDPGFETLLLLILEQQVSLASARAVYDRLTGRLGGQISPAGLLSLGDDDLRADGFSRQKTRYARALADAVLSGSLDFETLATLGDDTLRTRLTEIPGIGAWTAEVYLLMAGRRPDAFPSGDLALQVTALELKRLAARPSALELERLAEHWRPHRATAARLLWLHYLGSRGRLGG